VSGGFGVVVFSKDIYLYLVDSRYVHASFVQDHPLRIGGKRFEIRRIFVASRQGRVAYLREVETDFGVLIEGSEDVSGERVFGCDRSRIDGIEEVSGENRIFGVKERGIDLFWFQEGHRPFT
jgi:hypothetical protein